MTVVFTPPNTLPRIDGVWAYLSVDADGNEGVCAAPIGPGGMCVPLIAADEARLKSLTPIAEQLAKFTGMTIKLVRFGTREELREIRGNANG
jgi:hypothetical protein